MTRHSKLRPIFPDTTDLNAEVRAAVAELARGGDNSDCFVVGRFGIVWARRDAKDPTTFRLCESDPSLWLMQTSVPRWDSKNRVLTLGGRIVKRFCRRSPNQEAILVAFEEECWPHRIDDPLPPNSDTPPKLRLRDAIRWLNKDHELSALRFFGDGTGQGICWRLVASDIGLSDAFRRAA